LPSLVTELVGTTPFWGRYPSKYLEKDGAKVINEDIWIGEDHTQYLNENYFELVGFINRNPRYVNKRMMDPFIRMFIDECGIEVPKEWGLPVPNQAAAYRSLAKYAKDVPNLEEQDVLDLNSAWAMTERHFGPYMQNARVIGYDEAKTHLDMATSTGSPFNQHFKTKAELFAGDPEIDTWLQQDWEGLAVEGWSCLFTNSLKEEVRSREKMEKNSIRTFLAGGVDAVVHGTRLFVDMNEKFYDSHMKSSSAVGMSPYNANWDRLYRKLKVFVNGFALDESEYDSSLRVYLMWGCARMRWNMLAPEFRTKENMQRVLNYYVNLVNTLIVTPEGVIVRKKGGNPSGSVNTISDNTLILYTLLAYAWIKTAPKGWGYQEFELHTAKCLVGDDNTWTVSEEALVFYNARSVISVWKTLGITTTTDSLEPRKPVELDFLSAHTVFMHGVAVPVYERAKLMTSLLYAPREHFTPATSLQRCAALLSVGWTDPIFRKFCREFMDWLMEEYDGLLAEDPAWITAKMQIATDEKLLNLFIRPRQLRPQSVLGEFVKLSQPNKSTMSSAKPKRNGKKPGKKTQNPAGKAKPAGASKKKKQAIREKRAFTEGWSKTGGDITSAALDVFLPTQVARLGGNAAAKMMTAIGFGDYQIKKNSLLGAVDMGTSPPTVRNCYKGEGTVIHHREYLGELASGPLVGGSTAFTLQSYALNIGNSLLFPFGAAIASNFQEWEVNGILVELKSEASSYANTPSLGAMFAAVDYNSLDPAPTTKLELENMEYAVSNKPSRSLIMPVECARVNDVLTHLYVANDLNYEGGDHRFFDLGTLHIGSQGLYAETSAIAEIWITYDVTLFKPRLATQLAAPEPFSAHIQNTLNVGPDPPEGFMQTFTGCTIMDPRSMLATADENFIIMGPKGYGKRFIVSLSVSGNAASEFFTYPLLGATANYSTIEPWFNSPVGFNTLGVGTEAHTPVSSISARTGVFIWTIDATPGAGNFPSFVISEFSGFPKETQRVDCYIAQVGAIRLPPLDVGKQKERIINLPLPPQTSNRTVESQVATSHSRRSWGL